MPAPSIEQKVVRSASYEIADINSLLATQAAVGWRLVGVAAYGLLTYDNPGGVLMFFIKDH